ncbi:MAG: hypothetical protein EA398_05420, partial [Deltaproteobacteria bacterium]
APPAAGAAPARPAPAPAAPSRARTEEQDADDLALFDSAPGGAAPRRDSFDAAPRGEAVGAAPPGASAPHVAEAAQEPVIVQEREAASADRISEAPRARSRAAQPDIGADRDARAALTSRIDRMAPDDPRRPAAMLELARLEEQGGDRRAARRWYRRIVADHPDSDEAAAARRALER